MAKELTVTSHHDVGLYDSATKADCTTEKVVEVTDECPGPADRRSLFLYSRSKRGRIIKMVIPYPGEEFGISIHFFVDELDRELTVEPRDDTFGSWARNLGLSKNALISLIREHAPAA